MRRGLKFPEGANEISACMWISIPRCLRIHPAGEIECARAENENATQDRKNDSSQKIRVFFLRKTQSIRA